MQCSTSVCTLSRPPSSKGKERDSAIDESNVNTDSPSLEGAIWSPLSYSAASIDKEEDENYSCCCSRGSSASTSSSGSFVFEEAESSADPVSASSSSKLSLQAETTRPLPSIVVDEPEIGAYHSALAAEGSTHQPHTQDHSNSWILPRSGNPHLRYFSDSPLPECTSIPPSPAYNAFLPFSPALLSRKLETVIAGRLAEEQPNASNSSRPGTPHREADGTLQRALDFARFHQNRQVSEGRESAWQSEGFRALLASLDR